MIPAHLRCQLTITNSPVRIVQLTDCHLEHEAGGRLLGMDTDESLALVIDKLGEEPAPDLVLATGDLANHGSTSAYRRFREHLSVIDAPAFWMMGNHDDVRKMEFVARGGAPLIRCITVGGWQIILLDSTVPGQVGGTLGNTELNLLRDALAESADRHVLVCLHHHPVPIGCAWLDEQMVSDAPELLAVLDAEPRVKALLWGHVHQEYDGQRGHMRMLCSPSTCVQFAPQSGKFATDERAPGYRWLDLHKDGRVDTGVSRLSGVALEYDRNSAGYE